jgi:LCP family protein required for cell wall assembly
MPPEPFQQSNQGLWKRFLLGSVIIVVLMATATATAALLEVKHVADILGESKKIDVGAGVISAADAGAPETILVIGSDKRALSSNIADRSGPPHSDTLMLIRMDPNKNQTSELSIPRDLKTTIDAGRGRVSTQKINAAYSLGGAPLAAKTIKRLLGIQINDIIDINFKGFRRVVDAIGCVYVFVDRRYLHSNAGVRIGQQYAEINIQPGYQRLCGQTALDYARYRHTDSDFVRVARQQDFVRQAKEQVGVQGLINHEDQLLHAFARAAQTTIRGTAKVLRLFKLSAFSLGRPVRQVHFQATPGPSFVTASPFQIRATVNDFIHGNPPAKLHLPAVAAHRSPARARHRRRVAGGAPGVSPTPDAQLGRAVNLGIGFPLKLFAPRLHVQSGGIPDVVRGYTLRDNKGIKHHAYVISIARGLAGEYYGIEGTDWMDPPILAHPSETRTVGGRSYQLYIDGGHIRVVAWRTPKAVYWLNNTVLGSLTNRQMMAIAESSAPVN